MDFWGFEGRHQGELPGEQFAFLDPPVAAPSGNPPVAQPAGPPAAPPEPRDQPAVVATGTGAGVHYAEGPRIAAAQGALDAGYGTVAGDFRRYGGTAADTADIPTVDTFRTNPGAMTTWYTSHQAALERNGLPTGYGAPNGPLGLLVGRQNALIATKADIAAANPAGQPGGLDGIRDRANASTTAALDAYGPPRGGVVRTASDAPGGPGGGPAGGPGGPNAIQQYARGATDLAYAGVATRAAVGAWGGNAGGTAATASYADPSGYSSVGVGGGGYGGGGMGVSGMGDGFSYSGGVGDLTGTGYAIGQAGGDARSKNRAMDAMINQLLGALAQGNLDVLETAVTLCNQKAKMTIAGAAVKTVRAMQIYDTQMQQLSDRMGALAGQGNTQTMAPQLAQMNLQANQLSSGRQMISNNLKDLMTMQEEIGNTEKGVRDTMARIKTTQSRWS